MKRGKKKKGRLVKLHLLVIIPSYSHRPHPKTMGEMVASGGLGWFGLVGGGPPDLPPFPLIANSSLHNHNRVKYLSSGTCFASVVLVRTQTYNLSTSSWAWFCFLVEFSPDSSGKRQRATWHELSGYLMQSTNARVITQPPIPLCRVGPLSPVSCSTTPLWWSQQSKLQRKSPIGLMFLPDNNPPSQSSLLFKEN